MDRIHQNIMSKNEENINLINDVRAQFFSSDFSFSDPTRLSSELIQDIPTIGNQLKEISKLMDEISLQINKEDTEIYSCDVKNKISGGIMFNDQVFYVAFVDLPVKNIRGNTWTSHIPIYAYINDSCKSKNEMIMVLVPYYSNSYIVCEEIDDVCEQNEDSMCDMILFPGKIKIDMLNIEGENYYVGLYEKTDLKTSLKNIENKRLYDNPLTIDNLFNKNSNITSKNIIAYITDVYTRDVQSLHYGKDKTENAIYRDVIKFKVEDENDLSYYESLKYVPEKLDTPISFIEIDEKVTLFARPQDLKLVVNNNIVVPLPLSVEIDAENNYTEAFNFDITVLDLNFMWLLKDKDDIKTRDGLFYLSQDDPKYIKYISHSPNILYALAGVFKNGDVSI